MYDINSRMDAWAKSNRAQSSQEVESFLRSPYGNEEGVDHLSDEPRGVSPETINNNELSDGQTWERRRAKSETATDNAVAEGKKNPLFGRVKEAFSKFRENRRQKKIDKYTNYLLDKGGMDYMVRKDEEGAPKSTLVQNIKKSNPYNIDMRIGAWSMNGLKDSETEMVLKSTSAQSFFKKSAMCQEMIDTMSEDELGEALISAIEELLSRTGVDAE